MRDINEQFEQVLQFEELQSIPSLGISTSDLEDIIRMHTLEELDLTKDDAYLLHLIAPEELDDEENNSIDPEGHIVHEGVLSIASRVKRANSLRRNSHRYSLLRKIKSKRMADPQRLLMRARKAALISLRKRVAGKTGKNYSELSTQQKMQIDQALERKFGSKLSSVVSRLAQKLLMMIRRKEMGRLAHARGSTTATPTKDTTDVSESKKKKDDTEFDDEDLKDDDGREDTDSRSHATAKNRKLRRMGIREARKSGHDPNSNLEGMGSADHIIDSLYKAAKSPGHKVKWTHAEPSSIDPNHARMAIRVLGNLGSKPGMSGQEKQKITIRMSHSPHWFYKSLGLSEARKEKDEVKILKSFNKISIDKETLDRQRNFTPSMDPRAAGVTLGPTASVVYENEIGIDATTQKFAAATPGQTGNISAHAISAPIPWTEPVKWKDLLTQIRNSRKVDV